MYMLVLTFFFKESHTLHICNFKWVDILLSNTGKYQEHESEFIFSTFSNENMIIISCLNPYATTLLTFNSKTLLLLQFRVLVTKTHYPLTLCAPLEVTLCADVFVRSKDSYLNMKK